MTPLTLKSVSKELFSLAMPMALTQLITVVSGFLSMAMLSGMGHDVLAACALIFSARISIIIIGSSMLFSLSILIGHAYGEREYLRIGNFMQQGWLFGLLVSIPVMIIFWKMNSILISVGQPKVLADITQQFFRVNMWNVLPFMFCVSNQQLLYGTKKQQIDFLANVLGVLVVLISAYVLIHGCLGFKAQGVKGLAWALNLQGWFYFLFTSVAIYCGDFFKRFELFDFRLHQSFQDLIRLFKIGWPICVQVGSEMLYFFMSAAMVGWLGVTSLAAYQIVTQYLFLIVVPVFALAQASGVLVGQAYGEKNYLKINKLGHAAMLFGFIMTFIVALIFIFCPYTLSYLYLDAKNPLNENTIHIVVVLFTIVAVQQIFDGIRNVVTGSLRGYFDTRYPMLIGLLSLWFIAIPLGYWLAFHVALGVYGVVLGSTIGMFIGMVILMFRWQRINSRRSLLKLSQ